MNSIVQVCFKLYLPLGILALLFFAFMAMEVFVKSSMVHAKENRLDAVIQVLQVFGIIIGIIVTLFVYTPNGGVVEIAMGAAGFSVFGIIVIIVVYVIVKIFKIRHSTTDPVQWPALRAIAIQLSLLLSVTMLMVQVERWPRSPHYPTRRRKRFSSFKAACRRSLPCCTSRHSSRRPRNNKSLNKLHIVDGKVHTPLYFPRPPATSTRYL
jgi:hypothetical protein